MLNLSMERPDVIDAGVRDWNETSMGPHHGRVKDPMPWKEQVCLSLEQSLTQARFTHAETPGDRRCSLMAYRAAAVSDTLSHAQQCVWPCPGLPAAGGQVATGMSCCML